MNDFMALMTRQQNERELAVALEQRRLLRGAEGADPRFQRNPTVSQRLRQRLQLRIHRSPSPARPPVDAVHSNA
ncbi:hypothetical protein [Arthrobacter wenxiniae]|uniref:Uncharacterized protein n=1 Tax=Arthrobacter wenxiniae TaxID=2713570 RepID=A0A7Y7M1C4_9MICC|nr:hypothetical protein [Arthrobacter wenxiniae]NVM96924.1 hypothetical protein [Arthrobacter wenxiniae]